MVVTGPVQYVHANTIRLFIFAEKARGVGGIRERPLAASLRRI